MDFIEKIRELSARIPKQLDNIQTEEATKHALGRGGNMGRRLQEVRLGVVCSGFSGTEQAAWGDT